MAGGASPGGVRVLPGHFTHRPAGSSRSPGSTGSGRSSSSCAGSTGTSRPPPGRRRARRPGSPGRQTPTLEGRTERPRSRGPPGDAHARQGLPATGRAWEGPGGPVTGHTAPDAHLVPGWVAWRAFSLRTTPWPGPTHSLRHVSPGRAVRPARRLRLGQAVKEKHSRNNVILERILLAVRGREVQASGPR